MNRFALLLIFFLIPTMGTCANVKVVTTFSIIGDWVKNVGGENIDLKVLVGPNGDVHTYEPIAKDMAQIAGANIIFANGLNYEHWLHDVYKSSGSKAQVTFLASDLPNLRHLNANDIDPHVWHQVSYVVMMIDKIAKTLADADPVHANDYWQRAGAYKDQLMNLDQWIKNTVEALPPEKRNLVTSHDTFGYFARSYGFNIIGAATESATTEAVDPSAKEMVILLKKIKEANVHVIFAENIKNNKLIAMLSQEAQVQLAPVLYTDALGSPDSEANDYMKMMQYNVKTITEGLSK